MQKDDLMKFKLANIEECSEVADISTINLCSNLSQRERAEEFFKFVNNPYIVKVGDVTMKVNFKGDVSFSDAIINAANNS